MKNNLSKIIIADDHVMFRDGLKTIIEISKEGSVIADVSDGLELLDVLKDNKPDLLIVDIDMPNLNGIEATKKALELYPNLNVLTLTMFSEQKYYYDMISAGAKGFVLKTSSKTELMEAIRTVTKGGNYFSSELLDDIIKNINTLGEKVKTNHESIFTSKDIEILNLMQKGLSAKEISEELNLSHKTISNYKTLMLEKTGCSNAISLIIYALKSEVISL